MTTHRLDAGPETVHWGFFDATLKPLITVESGDEVVISTVSGPPAALPAANSGLTVPDALRAIHASVPQKLNGPHILTGPIAVRGAKAGQVLEVRIKAIDLFYDWGYNAIRPLAGALPDDFDKARLNQDLHRFLIDQGDQALGFVQAFFRVHNGNGVGP